VEDAVDAVKEEKVEKVKRRNQKEAVGVDVLLLILLEEDEEELIKEENLDVDVVKFIFFSAFLLFHKIIKNYHPLNQGF
jgi:hypothetical protein